MKNAGGDTDFLKTLLDGVESILKDPEATVAEKMAAITAGTKILQTKHKIKDKDDDTGSGDNFFGRGKRKSAR